MTVGHYRRVLTIVLPDVALVVVAAAHWPCTGAVEHAAEYVLTVQAGAGEAVSELALTG